MVSLSLFDRSFHKLVERLRRQSFRLRNGCIEVEPGLLLIRELPGMPGDSVDMFAGYLTASNRVDNSGHSVGHLNSTGLPSSLTGTNSTITPQGLPGRRGHPLRR